jgi:LysR family transcriptional regulator, positive regulator for ilvC
MFSPLYKGIHPLLIFYSAIVINYYCHYYNNKILLLRKLKYYEYNVSKFETPTETAMDYDSLKIFLHLTETMHFGKTSKKCFISASGLSRIIQRMEKEIGRELFIRDNHSVSITPAGLFTREYAIDALERWRIFKERTEYEQKHLHGDLNIYCSVTATYGILQNVLNTFRLLHPYVHIKLQTGEEAKAIQMVQNKSVDISIAAKPDKLPDNLEFILSAVTPLLFIAPKSNCYATNELKKDINKWWDLPLILPEHGLARKRIDELFRKNKKKLNIYADVSGNEAIIAMVSLGCGIGVVPELVLLQSPLRNEVEIIDIRLKLKPYQVGFCMNISRHIPLPVQAFRDILNA